MIVAIRGLESWWPVLVEGELGDNVGLVEEVVLDKGEDLASRCAVETFTAVLEAVRSSVCEAGVTWVDVSRGIGLRSGS